MKAYSKLLQIQGLSAQKKHDASVTNHKITVLRIKPEASTIQTEYSIPFILDKQLMRLFGHAIHISQQYPISYQQYPMLSRHSTTPTWLCPITPRQNATATWLCPMASRQCTIVYKQNPTAHRLLHASYQQIYIQHQQNTKRT